MQAIEAECLRRAFVAPQWLADGNSFWYRRKTNPGKSEFVFVDILKKSSRPAFDHSALAKALEQRTDVKVHPQAFPFTWIYMDPAHTSAVHFRFNNLDWKYGTEEGLSDWNGHFIKSNSFFLRKEVNSEVTDRSNASLSFTNYTRDTLKVSWISYEGKSVTMRWIGPGATRRQKTHPGHVWKFESTTTENAKVIYRVPKAGNNDVCIGEMDLDPYWGRGGGAEEQEKEQGKKGEAHDTVQENCETRKEKNIDGDDDKEEGIQLSVCDGDLWMKDEKGETFQLTSVGEEHQLTGYDETMIFKSPDEKFAVAWNYNSDAEEKLIPLFDYTPADQSQPKVKDGWSQKPGEMMRQDHPRLFNLVARCEVPTSDELFAMPLSLNHLGWNDESKEYRFIYNERGHQCARVLGIQCDGSVRVLLEEETDTFIDYMNKLYYHLIAGPDRLIWASERNGYNHLYMIDLKNGGILNQITTGEWNVSHVDRIDEEAGLLWVHAFGYQKDEDPYHKHLVRVSFDGTGCQALTQGDGTHSWQWSPNRCFIMDTYSRVDLPPKTAVRSVATGELQLMVMETSVEDLEEKGWSPPERFAAPGRDGKTLVYGMIVPPVGLNSENGYPVLEYVYGGPHDFHTPKQFGTSGTLYYWASQGFYAVQVDAMGTNWRSKKFHDVCWKNFKDAGLPDRTEWIKQAAATSTRSMDLKRVGVSGISHGGELALASLLHRGDFYRVAISDAGTHDHRIDKLNWNEQYLGFPVDDSYTDNSNITYAEKLEGKLMLVVGGLDTIAHPAATMKMVQRLNQNDKDYDLVFIPDGGHGCSFSGYALRRTTEFMRKHL